MAYISQPTPPLPKQERYQDEIENALYHLDSAQQILTMAQTRFRVRSAKERANIVPHVMQDFTALFEEYRKMMESSYRALVTAVDNDQSVLGRVLVNVPYTIDERNLYSTILRDAPNQENDGEHRF